MSIIKALKNFDELRKNNHNLYLLNVINIIDNGFSSQLKLIDNTEKGNANLLSFDLLLIQLMIFFKSSFDTELESLSSKNINHHTNFFDYLKSTLVDSNYKIFVSYNNLNTNTNIFEPIDYKKINYMSYGVYSNFHNNCLKYPCDDINDNDLKWIKSHITHDFTLNIFVNDVNIDLTNNELNHIRNLFLMFSRSSPISQFSTSLLEFKSHLISLYHSQKLYSKLDILSSKHKKKLKI